MMRLASVLAIALVAAVQPATDAFSPPRFLGGAVPGLPSAIVGGGEVWLEVDVDRGGRAANLTTLRATPPFDGLLAGAVRGWRFEPATDATPDSSGRAPVASKVLVAELVRPPTLNTPTLGEAPRAAGAASDQIAVPLSTVLPPYPPTALQGGVVLLEALVGATGAVESATVIESSPPFDEPARAALLAWRFRPARRGGRTVAAPAYVLFGFPQPVS
jgi:TonB family protein